MSRVLRGHGRVLPGEIAEATAEAKRIREEARRHGFEEGWQHGLASAAEVLARAHHEARLQRTRSEDDLRRLAVAIAEKILAAELSARPEAIAGIVRHALTMAGRRRDLVLRVHPEDALHLGDLAGRHGLAVETDESIRRGGCVLRAGKSTIDARLDVQLAALRRALCEDP